MKRTITILAGLAAIAGTAYLGSRLWAQTPPPYSPPPAVARPAAAPAPASPPLSRIAVVNLGQVIKHYQKFTLFQAELTKESQKFKKEYDDESARLKNKQDELQKLGPEANTRREQLERDIRDIQRRLQDYGEEIKKNLGKKQFEGLVAIYKDVKKAVSDYARPRSIELVLEYNDGIGEDEFLPAFMQKKLEGACWPLYMAPNLDITNAVTDMLNQQIRAGVSPAGTR